MNKMLVKSELEAERKLKLTNSAHHFEQTSEWLSELHQMNEIIRLKTAEVNDREQVIKTKQDKLNLLEQEVYMLKVKESSSPALMDLDALSFSAGVPPISKRQSEEQVDQLRMELQQCNEENNVLRAWNRQIDDALTEATEEMNAAKANAEKKAAGGGNDPKSSKDKDKDPFDFQYTDPKRDNKKGKGFGDPDPDDDDPDSGGGPPGPPGLPPFRGNANDDAASVSATTITAATEPRVSRRENDKVVISPWPKHQNLGIWQSDLIKSVCLAANDGDRTAWEEWLRPALQPNADLDALSDSGGNRYQSIDAKLSIALSNVISQAGDIARHVSVKLRLRTQIKSRQGTYVMGREILAMILSHFRTPGVRETAFTMEHIVKAQYLGDNHIDAFYEKWMEMVLSLIHI